MTSKYFQEKGWNVAATFRKHSDSDIELTTLGNVLVTELDVTKENIIKKAVAETVEKFGKFDVLLNNAGYGVWMDYLIFLLDIFILFLALQHYFL